GASQTNGGQGSGSSTGASQTNGGQGSGSSTGASQTGTDSTSEGPKANSATTPVPPLPDAAKRKAAADKGIKWELPKDDKRTAQDIIASSPALMSLENQNGTKDQLKAQVGDFENDPNAAYRAKQVLEHIEKIDYNGNRYTGGESVNGHIDGFDKKGHAGKGSEAKRLEAFGKDGFSALKGRLRDPASAAGDTQARRVAESIGIEWELPKGDNRSAQDIINQTPVLKQLGNQSQISEMLKEQVGDYETDPSAAYRAKQVLEHVKSYDKSGRSINTKESKDGYIHGFKGETPIDGSESERLVNFGKTGFSSLKGGSQSEYSSNYREYIEKNPNADAGSVKITGYAAILEKNYDRIKADVGEKGDLTAQDLKDYSQKHPEASQDVKEAIDFWSRPGAFSKLESAEDLMTKKPDQRLSKNDISHWIKDQAPTNAAESLAFLNNVAGHDAVAETSTDGLTSDVFEHPEKYKPEVKAAVVEELMTAQSLVSNGITNKMWEIEGGRQIITTAAKTNPDPEAILKDIGDHIATLTKDPDVSKILSEGRHGKVKDILKSNPGLRDAFQAGYDDTKSGHLIDTAWDANTKDGKTSIPNVVAEYTQTAQLYQDALDIDPNQAAVDLQDGVSKSGHGKDLETYYVDEIASGKRLNEMGDDPADAGKASNLQKSAAYISEASMMNLVLRSDVTDPYKDQITANFGNAAADELTKDATFDDMKRAFGIDGSDKLDEDKVTSLMTEVAKDHPEYLVNGDGSSMKPDQFLTKFRQAWDEMRQGTKTVKEIFKKFGIKPAANTTTGNLIAGYDNGTMHMISGMILAGISISKAIQSGGHPNTKDSISIAAGSVQTTTLITEGGLKAYKALVKKGLDAGRAEAGGANMSEATKKLFAADEAKANQLMGSLDKMGKAASAVGAVAGLVSAGYSIYDGVQSIRRGDKLQGAASITTGTLGLTSGVLSTAEAAITFIPGLGVSAGVAGTVAAISGAVAGISAFVSLGFAVALDIRKGMKIDHNDQKFGEMLGSYLGKYDIRGGMTKQQVDDEIAQRWPETPLPA
ncbi:type III effector HrpK domain-containing protein, partial [Methylobacterium sp. J-076]|uniref:type III effector HrpK domain-containing protein n=1 Tax=Methylobacterium sp. J-076 TaxID=2836655 RepID=UPI001FBB0B55